MTDPPIVEHQLPVSRTARYFSLGPTGASIQEVWLVCHGYGQLARYFLRRFAALNDGSRLIVAPEGLSRFYLSDPGGSHAKARVGATWMTREDRVNEIRDYVAYLDAVYRRVAAGLPRTGVRWVALGFSQGVATACRWAAMGTAPVSELILWAERVPPDLDLVATGERLRRMRITLVAGATDPAASPQALEEEHYRLAQHGIPSEVVTFPGGHELDANTLRAIAQRARDSGPVPGEPVG